MAFAGQDFLVHITNAQNTSDGAKQTSVCVEVVAKATCSFVTAVFIKLAHKSVSSKFHSTNHVTGV